MNLDQYKYDTVTMAGVGNVRLYVTRIGEPYPPKEDEYLPVSDYDPCRCPYCGCNESFTTRLPYTSSGYGCGGWSWRIYECHVVAATRPVSTTTYILGISERTPGCMVASSSNIDCDII